MKLNNSSLQFQLNMNLFTRQLNTNLLTRHLTTSLYGCFTLTGSVSSYYT